MPDRAQRQPSGSPAAKRPSTRALELVSELRDSLSQQVASAFAEHLKAAEADLRNLAERSDDPVRRELYESAFAVLRANGSGLLRAFRDSYTRACDQAVAALRGKRVAPSTSADQLALVDRNEFERDLAVGRLSAKATYACSGQLTALEHRVGALLDVGRLDSESNPFSVKRLFSAFLAAVRENWADEELALTLLETFEHYTAKELPAVYEDLNATLVEHGVLEKLKVSAAEPIPKRERAPEDATPAAQEQQPGHEDRSHRPGGPAAAKAPSSHGTGAGSSVDDVFMKMARGLLAAKAASVGGSTGTGSGGSGGSGGEGASGQMHGASAKRESGPETGFAAGAQPSDDGAGDALDAMQMGPVVLSQLLEGLTGLQRGNGKAAAKLGVDLAQHDPTSSAILHILAASPLLRWLQPTEAVTVNLTATLFDYILADGELADCMRGELGRLQLPILKVALLNKAFFADSEHPARQLMDLIDEATRGWNEQQEARLLDAIRNAVSQVIEDFDSDTDIFEAQVGRIRQILEDAERQARKKVGELVQRLEQRDRRLTADRVVGDAIGQRLDGQRLPAVVEEFIRTAWSQVLVHLYVSEGDSGAHWRQALSTVDDLAWSIRPKSHRLDRERLMRLLPDLLQRLPEGLACIGKSDLWHPFLRALMPLHMAAIKPPTETPREPGSGQPLVEPADSRADNGEPAPPGDSDHGQGSDEFDVSARKLAVGDWAEFADVDGAQMTLCASWISDVSGLILFADRQAQNPLVLTRVQFARHLRNGNARLLSRDPLTDRAVAQLLVYATPDGPSQD